MRFPFLNQSWLFDHVSDQNLSPSFSIFTSALTLESWVARIIGKNHIRELPSHFEKQLQSFPTFTHTCEECIHSFSFVHQSLIQHLCVPSTQFLRIKEFVGYITWHEENLFLWHGENNNLHDTKTYKRHPPGSLSNSSMNVYISSYTFPFLPLFLKWSIYQSLASTPVLACLYLVSQSDFIQA